MGAAPVRGSGVLGAADPMQELCIVGTGQAALGSVRSRPQSYRVVTAVNCGWPWGREGGQPPCWYRTTLFLNVHNRSAGMCCLAAAAAVCVCVPVRRRPQGAHSTLFPVTTFQKHRVLLRCNAVALTQAKYGASCPRRTPGCCTSRSQGATAYRTRDSLALRPAACLLPAVHCTA